MGSTAARGDHRRWKALVCPKNKYDEAKITKCCAFGEEMVYPPLDTDGKGRRHLPRTTCYVFPIRYLLIRIHFYHLEVLGMRTGGEDTFRCAPEDTRTNKDWTVRMNGFRFRLQGCPVGENEIGERHMKHEEKVTLGK